MNALNELDSAVRYLRERGARRESGLWMLDTLALDSDPLTAARALRAWLIRQGPAGGRQAEGRAVWTR